MDTRDDAEFDHDEADSTMISYVIEDANSDKSVICVHRCVCPTGLLGVSEGAAVRGADGLERWNGTVLDINGTCADLGS